MLNVFMWLMFMMLILLMLDVDFAAFDFSDFDLADVDFAHPNQSPPVIFSSADKWPFNETSMKLHSNFNENSFKLQ